MPRDPTVEAFAAKKKKEAQARSTQSKVEAGRKALREHNTRSAKAKRTRAALTKKFAPRGLQTLLESLSGKKK